MKRQLFFVILLALTLGIVSPLVSQSSFAVVKSSGTTIVRSTLKDAVDAASTGDIIYLPSGNIAVTGLTINKGVHLIGMGYHPDSTGAAGQTVVNGNLVFVSGADGGSVQGVFVNGAIQFGTGPTNNEVHNFVISRCYIAGALYLAHDWSITSNSSNFTISENIINYGICGARASNVVLANNIIVQIDILFRPITLFANAIIQNNILIPLDNSVSNGVTGTTFKNNVIVLGTLAYVNEYSGNIYLNNLHSSPSGLNSAGVTTSNGNVYITRDNMFVKQSGGRYSFTDDYHLSAAALSAIKGTDGTQVGIYGSATAFKDGGMPPNPAILQAKVATKTNAKGKLEVEFKVQTQSK